MNVYTLNGKQKNQIELSQKFDLSDEYFAIASNSLDKIAIGGDKQQIDVHVLNQEEQDGRFEENVMGEPSLAMKFQSPVQRIQWVGKYIVGYSEDSMVQLYNQETEKVLTFKPGHEGSIKNGALDPLGEYLATSGCDGQVNIYKIKQSENEELSAEFIKKIKITKAKTQPFDKNPLDITWTPDGSQLLVSGEPALGSISRNDWTLNYSTHFVHKQNVSNLCWINDTVLVTASMDKIIKFWDYNSKTLLYHTSSQNEIIQLAYCSKRINMEDEEMKNDMVEDQINDEDLVNNLELSQEQITTNNAVTIQSQAMKSEATNQNIKSQQSVVEQTKVAQKAVTIKAGKSILNDNEPTQKIQTVKSKADDIIDVYPQATFIPNCQYDFPVNKYRVLAWNMVGTICLREEAQFTSVDVDFTNKQMHRNLMFNNDYGAQMAALNYSGLLLASKAVDVDLDNYEEDDMDDDDMNVADKETKNLKKYAHLYYKPFSQYKNLKDWHLKLDLGENIECLAIGSGWCAVYTDLNYVRIFSAEGIQKYIFCLGTPLVTMVGYENLLSIVYHSGPAVYGCQAFKIKTIDMSSKNYTIISDIECPITRGCNLIWIGYSEEGQLFTYDNDGILRQLNPLNNQWLPALDFRISCPQTCSQLWIVGICEQEVLALELPKGYSAPHLHQKSLIRRFKLKMPFLDQEKKDIDSKELTLPQLEEEILRRQQKVDFESFRKDQWEQLKHFRSKYDNEYVLSESIMNNSEINQMKKEIDKLLLNAIRMCIVSEDQEKVFTYMDLLHFSDTLKICVKLCDSLNAPDLAQKIGKFIQEKEQKEIMIESYNKTSNKSSGGFLANRKMFKSAHNAVNGNQYDRPPDLSQFAISNQSSQQQNASANNEEVRNTTQKVNIDVTQEGEQSKNSNMIQANSVALDKPIIQKTQNSKNNTTSGVDLTKKSTTGNTNDIFKDLSDTKALPQVGMKRQNPFAQDNKQPTKQKKLNKQDLQFDSANTYSQEIPNIKVPEDTNNIGYLLMLLFGIGSLLPWNAILTALDFFIERMGEYQPQFVFGFAVNGLLTITLVVVLLYGHKVSYVTRISGGFLIMAGMMIALPLVANALNADAGFAVCISILLVFGAIGGVVQGSVFGLAGMFPFKYMGAVMFGNGMSGIILNALRAICLAIFPPVKGSDNNFKGSLVYFILAAIILVLSAAGMVLFMRLPFAQYYIRKATTEKFKTQRRISGIKEDMDDDSSLLGGDINKTNHESNLLSQNNNSVSLAKQAPQPQISAFKAFLIMMKRSFLISWQFLISITCVFVITFTVFPGVSLNTHLKFMNGIEDTSVRGAWQGLILIIIFNIFDTVGRWLGGQKFGQASDRLVLILTYSRLIYIVTFILISLSVEPSWLFGDDADWFKIINMIAFSFTNGYCSTQCAIKAPSRAPDDSKEQVGTFIGLFLTLGILIGSIIAIGMGHAIPPV